MTLAKIAKNAKTHGRILEFRIQNILNVDLAVWAVLAREFWLRFFSVAALWTARHDGERWLQRRKEKMSG
jgi:hypothetical protein